VPSVLGILAVTMPKVVDFPLPLGPRSANIYYFSTAKDIPLRATKLFS
jgi:hypothetical protein